MEQYRLEKQLDISEGLSRDTQQLARRHLACVHKAWANWHIERGDYQKARESVSIAAKYGISPSVVAKSAGLRLAPSLLRWAISRVKKKAMRYDRSSWLTDESIGLM